MKILVAYYSRTGITRKIAEYIAKEIGADIEEIIDLKNRKGPINYVIAGKDATQKKLTDIKQTTKKIQDYDIIILGTPIWAWTIAPAIRTYIKDNITVIKDKKVIAFCTMGASGSEGAFEAIEQIIGKPLLMTNTLLTRDIVKNLYYEKLKDFLQKIRFNN